MAELNLQVPSTYVGPSCGEAANSPHAFKISFTKSRRTGEIEVYAQEGRVERPGSFTMMLFAPPEDGNRRIAVNTCASRATAKTLATGCMTVLQALKERGWIAELPSSATVAAAIN